MDEKTERLEMRVPERFLAALDSWRAQQSDLPSRSDAVRRLVEQALASAPKSRAKSKSRDTARAAGASRAEKAAGEQIDRALKHSGQSEDVKGQRKRRLTRIPTELQKAVKGRP